MRKKKPKTTALLLLGMHRSGTSAAARLINLLGADIGERVISARRDNIKGFWEHRDIVDIHDRLLAMLRSSWDDTRGLPPTWWRQENVGIYREEISAVLARDFTQSSVWVMKDPRLCLLLPLWRDILNDLGVEPRCILMLRHPAAVAESLRKRDHFLPEKSLLLWCLHMLQAERDSRGLKRAILPLSSLMQEWRGTMKTVAVQLSLQWPAGYEDSANEIEAFLEPELIHATDAAIVCGDERIAGWARTLYTLLASSKPDAKALDALYEKVEQWLAAHRSIAGIWVEEALAFRAGYADQVCRLRLLEERIRPLEAVIEERDQAFREEEHKAKILEHRIALLEREYKTILASTAWKLTWPWRVGGTALRRSRLLLRTGVWRRAWQIGRTEGLHGLRRRVRNLFRAQAGSPQQDYAGWIQKYDTLSEEDRHYIRRHSAALPNTPLISVVMPVYNVAERWLRQSIESVRGQLYPHWELCIADDCSTAPHVRRVLDEYAEKDARIKVTFRDANGHISACSNSALALAKGEFVALLDHDDMLPEHALYMVACEINKRPDADLIYSDEDKIDADGNRHAPYFKSDWNLDLFFGQNMFSHLGVYRKALLDRIGGFRKGYEGSQDYDLCLRCLPFTSPEKIRHIPHVLYHWRAIPGSTALANEEKEYAKPSSDRALTDYFAAQKIPARIVVAKHHVHRRVCWELPDPAPLVSIIIPTRNGHKLLEKAVRSIRRKTEYPRYELLIVDNQSDDEAALRYLERLDREPDVRVIPYSAPFNFPAINNMAATQANGDILTFLNNDVEIINPDWLAEMVSHALRPDVGAVGAVLYYPDDTVQHGGIALGTGSIARAVASTLSFLLPRGEYGYFGRAALTQQLSAVTAACMVMRRVVFDAAGRFDAENLPVAFNDVDLCLRLQEQGYKIIWTPFAELYHAESATRGKENTQEKKTRFHGEALYMRRRWGEKLTSDPFYNPNLDAVRADFSLAFPPRVKYSWQES